MSQTAAAESPYRSHPDADPPRSNVCDADLRRTEADIDVHK